MAVHVPLEEIVKELPEEIKAQVYDFASYFLEKRLRDEDRKWSAFSLGRLCGDLKRNPSIPKLTSRNAGDETRKTGPASVPPSEPRRRHTTTGFVNYAGAWRLPRLAGSDGFKSARASDPGG